MKEIQIRLSGTGGQGLQLSAKMLAEALIQEGRQIAQSQSYEPTSRGGLSRADLVIGEEIPDYPLVTNLNALLILDQLAADASTHLLQSGGVVITDSTMVKISSRRGLLGLSSASYRNCTETRKPADCQYNCSRSFSDFDRNLRAFFTWKMQYEKTLQKPSLT